MRRPLLAALVLALLAPAAASAHGSIEPTATGLGASVRFVLTVANTLAGGPGVVGVEVTLPAGATLESGEGNQPRWQVTVRGTSVVWRGGPIEGLSEDFAFRAKMPEVEGPVDFEVRELYADGAGPPFPLTVVVTQLAGSAPDGAAAASTSDDTLAWIAIAVAVTALLLALGAVAVVLSLRRRL